MPSSEWPETSISRKTVQAFESARGSAAVSVAADMAVWWMFTSLTSCSESMLEYVCEAWNLLSNWCCWWTLVKSLTFIAGGNHNASWCLWGDDYRGKHGEQMSCGWGATHAHTFKYRRYIESLYRKYWKQNRNSCRATHIELQHTPSPLVYIWSWWIPRFNLGKAEFLHGLTAIRSAPPSRLQRLNRERHCLCLGIGTYTNKAFKIMEHGNN